MLKECTVAFPKIPSARISRSLMKNQRQHWQGGIRAAGGEHRLLPAAPHPAADRASPMRMRHATAQPTSAEGRDPEGDPPRQSNRVRQYPRSRIRRASSAPRDRAALPRSGMRDHRGNAFDDGGNNCRGSTVIQRPHRPSDTELHTSLLLVRRGEHLHLEILKTPHLLFQLLDLLFEAARLGFERLGGSCRSALSSCCRYRATLSSICAMRRSILARVKFLSRLFTALNLRQSRRWLA